MLTEVLNAESTEPSLTSLKYYCYSNGNLIEQLTSGVILQTTSAGTLDTASSSIVPDDFRQSKHSNYTLSFKPVNYRQNMKLLLKVPVDIRMPLNQIKCFGVQGTDVTNLTC